MKKYQSPIIGAAQESTYELNPVIFSQTLDEKTLGQVIRVYQSNSHQKTKKTKTRSEVDGSTRKIYAQKGTGNARHGSLKAPIFVGGGIAHGPSGVRPGNLRLNQKLKAKALAAVLATKLADKHFYILEVPKLDEPSTKVMARLLKSVQPSLIVYLPSQSKNLFLSSRNLDTNQLVSTQNLNAYEALAAANILFTAEALDQLQTRLLPFLEKTK